MSEMRWLLSKHLPTTPLQYCSRLHPIQLTQMHWLRHKQSEIVSPTTPLAYFIQHLSLSSFSPQTYCTVDVSSVLQSMQQPLLINIEDAVIGCLSRQSSSEKATSEPRPLHPPVITRQGNQQMRTHRKWERATLRVNWSHEGAQLERWKRPDLCRVHCHCRVFINDKRCLCTCSK